MWITSKKTKSRCREKKDVASITRKVNGKTRQNEEMNKNIKLTKTGQILVKGIKQFNPFCNI